MAKYILKRVAISLITIFVIITITFFLMYCLPGKPFIGDRPLPESVMKAATAKYGLDKPVYERYVIYLTNILKGDFGTSITYKNREVTDIIKNAFPVSADLGLRALFFGVLGGVLLGIVGALNHNKVSDRVTTIIAIIGVSLPSFILGTMLQYLLGIKFSGWFKDVFHTDYQVFPISQWGTFRHTLIPAFVLGLGSLSSVARMMRVSMLEVTHQDYIKTSKAKGITSRAIVVKHMIRNAILPVFTVLGNMIGFVLTGSFVIENIFSIPGLGKYFVSSVTSSDYTMTMGLTLFYAIFIVSINLLVDLAYGFIDPRVRIVKGGNEI